MQPAIWQPEVTLSSQEEQIIRKIRKAKLFVFLRQHRHEVFDEAFQEELAGLYRKTERGQPPVPPAVLALALILEAVQPLTMVDNSSIFPNRLTFPLEAPYSSF